MVFSPMIDGVVVRDDIYTALENNTAGDIPFFVGVTDNEVGNMWDPVSLPDDLAYRNFLANLFTDPLDDQLYALYPTANYATPKDALNELWADVAYSCAAERLARAASTGAPSYLYEISRGFDTGFAAGQGAVHAIDITFLFGNFGALGITPDAQGLFIRDSMRTAWQGMAADPTTAPPIVPDAAVQWPVYDATNATYTSFGDTVEGLTNHRDGRCAAVIDLIG